MKKLSLLFVFGLLLAVGCLQVSYWNEDNAIKVANGFLKHLIRQEYYSAYDAYLSDDLKRICSFSVFESNAKASIGERGLMTKATFDCYTINADKRGYQLFYNVKHENDSTLLYRIVLLPDSKGEYKVVGFYVNQKNPDISSEKGPEDTRFKKSVPIIVTGH